MIYAQKMDFLSKWLKSEFFKSKVDLFLFRLRFW